MEFSNLEFRPRDYKSEEELYSLSRVRTAAHPLSTTPSPPLPQDFVVDREGIDFFDPLRGSSTKLIEPVEDVQVEEKSSTANKASVHRSAKEWSSFKKFLMQRFTVPKMVSISLVSSKTLQISKVIEKPPSTIQLEDNLENLQKFAEEGVEVISQQEYVSRLHEFKNDIIRAWHSEDRVTSLKLSIKVARLLRDTYVLQFYPTVFVLATDILDMLGDMVWERIRQRAEFTEDGARICSLPDDFEASSICFDAKEICINWFSKIGSIQELVPRIYLELAIFPCWQFLHDRAVDSLMRLVMMTRGISNPLASAYCHLYLVHRSQKLPHRDTGHLIACVNDLKVTFAQITSGKGITCRHFPGEGRLLVSLMEPTIEYILKCIFKETNQVAEMVVKLGLGKNPSQLFEKVPCVSVILHHLLKELPIEVICSSAMEVLNLIECNVDGTFDQCLTYRMLGLKLCEGISKLNAVDRLIDKVIEVATQMSSLGQYLEILDAYMDIVLQYHMDGLLNVILSGIFDRLCSEGITENEQGCLQSVVVKLIAHFDNIETIFALNHFVEIIDMIHGSSRSIVSMHILIKATSRNDRIDDLSTIQLLFEVAQSLHDNIDFSVMQNDDTQQPEHLIVRFLDKVDHPTGLEGHLTFLVECRGAFGSMNELKENLVHSSNYLATKAMRDGKDNLNFIKSCLAFNEVTIPSIPAYPRQMNLYLETAEVALLGGLISHSDGLVDSAICCLQNVALVDGFRKLDDDVDRVISLMRKLCSFMLLVPGNPVLGVMHVPNRILSLLNSESWMVPTLRIRVLCSIVSLFASYSQDEFPYYAMHEEVVGNDLLFFGVQSYSCELLSISGVILENIIKIIPQEASQAARGKLALEACNCIASVFKVTNDILSVCTMLVETGKRCLGADNKYLHSTIDFLHKQSQRDCRINPSC